MLSLLLGAGFSKWAAGFPVASELFDFKITPFGKREPQELEKVKMLKRYWDEQNPYSITEEFIQEALTYDYKNKKRVLWYIARRLSERFIWKEFHAGRWRRHVLMIDENRKYKIPGVSKVQNFLKRFTTPNLSGIVTTNYDLLVEYAFGTKNFNYGKPGEVLSGRGPYPISQWKNPVTLEGPISIAKIHGSFSWDGNRRYTDGRGGITGNVLIVAPAPEKKPPVQLSGVWELARDILSKSNKLLVFGFAFNPYDEAVLNLIKDHGKNLKNVLIIDINPQLKTASELWPEATVIPCKPPPEEDNVINDWLRNR